MFRPRWFTKPWLAWWILLASLTIQCRHPQHRGEPAPQPIKENKDGSLQFLVEDGESSQAVYSPDGDRILFVSKRRLSHDRNQVYEKDLKSGVERRITFQNGNAYQPRYHPKDGWIVYASSTDELEESPVLLQPTPKVSKLPFPYQEQMEIYVQALRGFDITRLTKHPGFDGEARFSSDGRDLSFTRVIGQKTQILTINRQSAKLRELTGLGVNPTQFTVSPDGKARAWVEWDESFGVSRLRLQKGRENSVEVTPDMIVDKTDLMFSADSRRLFWAQKDGQKPTHALWTLELDQPCPRPLTTDPIVDYRDPTLSPDLRWLTFTLRDKHGSRIARMGFVAPAGPCPAHH